MLPKGKWAQFGHPGNKVKGIVIHNTNNEGKSAKQLAEMMKTIQTSQGTHYFVDSTDTIKMMPLNWSVFNVGNGFAFGNTDCIAIEICSHPSKSKYMEGEDRAIELIRELMSKYNLSKEQIYFHNELQRGINCPAQIIKIYGSKSNFLNRI